MPAGDVIPRFEFATAARIVFGAGTLNELPSIAKPFGRRPLIVTGRNLTRVEAVVALLAPQCDRAEVFSVSGEPTTDVVRQAVGAARNADCDFVVSFGGGSAIDAGKAIAALLTNSGDVFDYLEVIGRSQPIENAPAPFIAIPTTAGTGSEVTRNAVLASPAHKVKASLRSALMLPRIALIDPELTFQLPRDITASTGMDALTQLIEPYVSCRANPMIDALCLDGIRRVARSLRSACDDGNNHRAREDMALASLFGGLALANAGLGAVHGFAAPIGGMFAAPHGAVCATLLPHVVEANINALRERAPTSDALRKYGEIALIMTGNTDPERVINWTKQLCSHLDIPPLRTYGVRERDIRTVVENAMKASSMKANPIGLSADELAATLRRAL